MLPVSRESAVPGQMFTGGSAPRDDRRQVLSRRYLQPLKEIVARAGSVTMSQASKLMMQKEGFKRTLSELRMDFRAFVKLWPDFQISGTGSSTRLTLKEPFVPARTGTLRDFAEPS